MSAPQAIDLMVALTSSLRETKEPAAPADTAAPATTPEPVKLDYSQRGLTYEQLGKLVSEAVGAKASACRAFWAYVNAEEERAKDAAADRAYAIVLAGLLSIERERNQFRATLEKIATGAYTRPGARDLAKEALQS